MKRVALLDGDILVFKAAFACERTEYILSTEHGYRTIRYKRDLDTEVEYLGNTPFEIKQKKVLEPLSNALSILSNMMYGWTVDAQCSQYRVFLSGDDNFRKQVAVTKPYKGNRNSARPTYEQEIKAYLRSEYNAEQVDNLEADDLMAMNQGPNTVICTIDKDLRQVPGWHLNPDKEEEPVLISNEKAKYNYFWQMLVGDDVDNIPGVRRIGKKKATAMLEGLTVPEMKEAVIGCYRKAYGDDYLKVLNEQHHLIYMRRKPISEKGLIDAYT